MQRSIGVLRRQTTLPCLPHEESSPFSLRYALFVSCSRADERSCGLGGKTSTESEEKRCLKRRKEDFREAMHVLLLPQSCVGLAALLLAAASGHSLCGSQGERRRMPGTDTRERSGDRTSCLCQTMVQRVCYSNRSMQSPPCLFFFDNDISVLFPVRCSGTMRTNFSVEQAIARPHHRAGPGSLSVQTIDGQPA